MRAAQRYPQNLCRAICEGLLRQKKDDLKCLYTLGQIHDALVGELEEARRRADELHEAEEWHQAWDDVTGRELLPELVRRARHEEIAYFRKMKVCTKVPIAECRKVSAKRANWSEVGGHKQGI